jgi:hypothetical protein
LGPHYQRQLISPNRPEQEKSLRARRKKSNYQKRLGYSETVEGIDINLFSIRLSTILYQLIASIILDLTHYTLNTLTLTQCIVNITPVISPSPQHGTRPTKTMKEADKQAHAPNEAAKA